MRLYLILAVLTILNLTSLAQAQDDIDALLIGLSGQSENITKEPSAIKLISRGNKQLLPLSKKFNDSTKSSVFSTCIKRFLTRGEIAIILADRIESMPYFTLTGLENCTMDMCKDNPNFIEYYLNYIKQRGMTALFQQRYENWLKSAERKKVLVGKTKR